MQIRRLTFEEHLEANLISALAFHVRISDLDAQREKWARGAEHYKKDDWGAFSEDGALMAHAVNSSKLSYFNGARIACSCVGAVSTLPEYRNTGAVRAMFGEMLRASREEGAVISALYPFSHGFYRKFGYETVCYAAEYTLPATAFGGYRHDGWVKMWHPGETPEFFTQVYNEFAKKYNLALVRDDALTGNSVRGTYYNDRRFCYLLGDAENGPTAYAIFEDIANGDSHRINVVDCAYTGPCGLRSLLGFLARFSADYSDIRIKLPLDIDLRKLLDDPYVVQYTVKCDYMARVLNAPKILSMINKPGGAPFTIMIDDKTLPVNSGTWLADGQNVSPTSAAPDIAVSERALAQLVTGASSLDEALLRRDVQLFSNYDALRAAFPARPVGVFDHF